MRLKKAEGEYGDGADGASTADMVAAVTDVRSVTHSFKLNALAWADHMANGISTCKCQDSDAACILYSWSYALML